MLACARQVAPGEELSGRVTPLDATQEAAATAGTPIAQIFETPTTVPTLPVLGSPTPDPTRAYQTGGVAQVHAVNPGETLAYIAAAFGVPLTTLLEANALQEDDFLIIGQELVIPAVTLPFAPGVKLIPDSELVYGPGTVGFDVAHEAQRFGGYLSRYIESGDDGVTRSGPEIVRAVAQRYSVNPRLLLTVLEHQSGWLANANPSEATLTYPIGKHETGREGLLKQLSWAADLLNAGFYGWRAESVTTITIATGEVVAVAPGMNAGTVGVQLLFSQLQDMDSWTATVTPGGFDHTYASLFGNPFIYTVDPLLPAALVSPALGWPWLPGEVWYFTGGPHGGWDFGSAWAAIDFGAPDGELGCEASAYWVRAATAGRIVRSHEGAVLQDLDGDGFEQTGWVIFYMHVDSAGRVPIGAELQVGDQIGRPSCEGGFSNATHLHLARKYNGVWIAADDTQFPFRLAGWTSVSAGKEYDGWLVRDNLSLEACNCRDVINEIAGNLQ